MPEMIHRDNLIDKTRKLVRQVAGDSSSGKEKAKFAARLLAKWIDVNTDTGPLEPYDRPAFNLVGLALVEFAYRGRNTRATCPRRGRGRVQRWGAHGGARLIRGCTARGR